MLNACLSEPMTNDCHLVTCYPGDVQNLRFEFRSFSLKQKPDKAFIRQFHHLSFASQYTFDIQHVPGKDKLPTFRHVLQKPRSRHRLFSNNRVGSERRRIPSEPQNQLQIYLRNFLFYAGRVGGKKTGHFLKEMITSLPLHSSFLH